jgi:hypothetical protein
VLKQRERRIGDDDVGLFEERDTLGAAEVAAAVLVVCFQGDACGLVALEEELHILDVHRPVAVLVFHVVEDDGHRLGLLAFAVALVVFREERALPGDGGAVVAGGDELLEAELVEVCREVLEEVALEGVVAVAVDDLAAEGVRVELEVGLDLFLDVDVLRVELVLLGGLGGTQATVEGLACHGAVGFLGFVRRLCELTARSSAAPHIMIGAHGEAHARHRQECAASAATASLKA